jgi:two-component system, NarL family, sensor histidine kinase UhpB
VASGSVLAPAPVDTGEERSAHFARELHDQVAQPLVGLILELHELRANQHLDQSTAVEMSRVEDSARRVLRQAREMLIELRGPRGLRLDFVQALRSELRRGGPAGTVPHVHVTSRWPQHINGWAAFNLLRIAQEAVTNALRHGRAHKVDVFLDTRPDGEAVMVVIDDGVGIDDAPSGFGMMGMTERTVILGGTFKAAVRESGGTRVEVRVPLHRLE